MKLFFILTVAFCVTVAPCMPAAGQALETYHAKHRAASELVSIAKAGHG